MSSRISRRLEDMVRPSATAMLMWDFQVGLGGNAHDYGRLIEVNARLLDAADEAGVRVIWSRHTMPPLNETTPGMLHFLMRKQKVMTTDELEPFMQPGSPEREFVPDIGPREHDIVIEKGVPSFFVGTTLELRLRALGVENVIVTGVTTDIGVDLTAKHALALGYVPVVVEDAVDSYSAERHEAGLAALRTWIPVVPSSDVIEAWKAATA